MATPLSMLDLARELAQIASETREPDTAVMLIALVNRILAATGGLPKAAAPGSAEDDRQTQ
jgi:hypothetical protein